MSRSISAAPVDDLDLHRREPPLLVEDETGLELVDVEKLRRPREASSAGAGGPISAMTVEHVRARSCPRDPGGRFRRR